MRVWLGCSLLASSACAVASLPPASDSPVDRTVEFEESTEVVGEHVAVPEPGEILDVSLGDRHGCLLERGGEVLCWGSNEWGQLGVSDPRPRDTPSQPVAHLPPATALASTWRSSCALVEGGRVWCWGEPLGASGPPRSRGALAAHEVRGVEGAVQIVAGTHSVCARAEDGHVTCWGEGTAGQLGDANGKASTDGVVVAQLDDVVDLAAQGRFACAAKQDGSVWCWGRTSSLMPKELEPRLETCTSGKRACATRPIQLAGFASVVDVSVGQDVVCGRTAEGAVTCWSPRPEGGASRKFHGAPVTAMWKGCLALADGRWTCAEAGARLPAVLDRGRLPVRLAFDSRPTHGERGCALWEDALQCWGGERWYEEEGRDQPRRVERTNQGPSEPWPGQLQALHAKDRLRGYAFVWANAEVFSEADEGTNLGALDWREDALRHVDYTERYLVRIVEDRGELVRVEPLPDTDGHCEAWPFPFTRDFDLRMWVRRTALAPVVARTVTFDFADGSSATVGAGISLRFAGDALVLEGTELEPYLDLGPLHPDVGFAYRKPGHGRSVDPAPGHQERVVGDPTLNGLPFELYWTQLDTEPIGDTHLRARYANECIDLWVVGRDDGPPYGAGFGGRGTRLPRIKQGDVRSIPKGTAVSWVDGKHAGKTARRLVYATSRLHERGDRTCMTLDGTVEVCVASSSVVDGP